ncbi:unnamed protein product [Haemonchus placei]|uniref:Integrase catalytic domain-containing protein n=1 Tax=Haemonchus placei TaxID=6290 RepID=A0A0N4WWY4_HAEPC|nr:unnamed protein product [Haemonchus placei]
MVARTLFERWMADGCRIPKPYCLTKAENLTAICSKGYNPHENGITERFDRTIIGLLRKKEGDMMIPYCMIAYNTTAHEATVIHHEVIHHSSLCTVSTENTMGFPASDGELTALG